MHPLYPILLRHSATHNTNKLIRSHVNAREGDGNTQHIIMNSDNTSDILSAREGQGTTEQGQHTIIKRPEIYTIY